MSRAEFAKYMMKSPANFYYGVIWNKFYQMDIIKENQLYFSTRPGLVVRILNLTWNT